MDVGFCAKISARSKYLFDRLELKRADLRATFGTPRDEAGQSGNVDGGDEPEPVSVFFVLGCSFLDSSSRATALSTDKDKDLTSGLVDELCDACYSKVNAATYFHPAGF